MPVTYTPALREQIRGHHTVVNVARVRPIAVRSAGHFVERVDPVTRQCTGEVQQFLKSADGSLTILPRSEWVKAPEIVDVDGTRYR